MVFTRRLVAEGYVFEQFYATLADDLYTPTRLASKKYTGKRLFFLERKDHSQSDKSTTIGTVLGLHIHTYNRQVSTSTFV